MSFTMLFCIGFIAWQGRVCAISYHSFSLFMQHVYSQVSRLPCDAHNCSMCTAESHQDFSHVEYRDVDLPGDATETPRSLRSNLFPEVNSAKTKKSFKRKLRHLPHNPSTSSYSPRVFSTHPHSKSVSPSCDNPFEEEFIQEILTPKQQKNSSIFPNIHPPSQPKVRRIRISAGPSSNRRTVSAPSVENTNLRAMFSKT